jgi:hypothetical protein
MGNNNSSPFCGECDCAGQVPRVIAACNTAGEAGVSRTLEQTITGLLGKENSDFIMDTYTNTLDNETSNSKWVSDYNKIKETFNNYEGFIEGNCIPCDCKQAADEIITACQNSGAILPVAISELIDDDIIREDTNKLTSAIMDSAKDDNTETNDDWRNIFYHNIRTREPLKNIEGNQNMGLYAFSVDAMASRHAEFSNRASFPNACANNAYEAIKGFIIEEKNILDSLHTYYLTYIKDYESLYLHKESFSKTIYNKLNELEKIQAKIDSYKTNLHVDNRKNLYQTNNYEFYTNIRFYILIVYYSVLIIYLIFSKFFSEKQYTNKFLMLLLFIYLIIPIILEHLINFAYEGYIYFLEYTNMKEDTKSYEDIINKY